MRVIRHRPAATRKFFGEGICQRFLSAAFVMPKRLAVGRCRNQLSRSIAPYCLTDAPCQMPRTAEDIVEAHVAGNRIIVEKDVDVRSIDRICALQVAADRAAPDRSDRH